MREDEEMRLGEDFRFYLCKPTYGIAEEHLARQAVHTQEAMTLLKRKNAKMGMVHVLKEDISRYLDEG